MTRPTAPPRPGPQALVAWVAAVLAAVLLLLLVGGVASAAYPDRFYVLDLDAEWRVAALVSAALLVGAGGLLAWGQHRSGCPRAAYALPLLLGFMAADELLQLHERAELATGVDWQLLYLPLVAACAWAWLLVLRQSATTPTVRALLVAGASAWVVAQVLEKLEYDAADLPVSGYVWYMVPEELLEAAGSSAFLLAGLVLGLGAGARSRSTAGRARLRDRV